MSRRPQRDGRRGRRAEGSEGAGPDLAEKLAALPDAPGVYLHRDRRGKVIYVGKAGRLSQRVRHYFQSGELDRKTAQLVARIHDFDWIATASETEALILESQLIKEYRPRYNVQLKDDKQYPYLRIRWAEPFPRVEVVRRIADDGSRHFGPYTDARSMRETLKFAAGVFQVRTCHLDLPDRTVARPCLDYQIGRCSAPCVGLDDAASYRRRVRQLILFLEGRDRSLLAGLRRQMATLAAERRYEEAAGVRDRLERLERTISRSRPVPGLGSDLDACAVAREGQAGCGVVLRIRRGKVLTVHQFQLSDRLERDTGAFLAQLLREYYPRAGDIPAEVVLAQDLPDLATWTDWLGRLRGRPVRLHRAVRGAKRRAVEMAAANAGFKLAERAAGEGIRGRRLTPANVQLQEALGLHTPPETIACVDISALQGREAVGSLVFFRGGEPLKSRYRRFRIRTVAGVDDYAMMEEVLDRHCRRLRERQEEPADLVMVDGGAGQLGVARRVLTRHGFHATQLVGLAKREELVHVEGGGPPVRLPRGGEALRLLQRVRDEAHRFAISYHRLLRDQRTTASVLDAIPGIGRVKKLSLLHRFGSVAEIARADAAQLRQVRGLNRHDVQAILGFFAARGKS